MQASPTSRRSKHLSISGPILNRPGHHADIAAHRLLGIDLSTKPRFFNLHVDIAPPIRRLYHASGNTPLRRSISEYSASTTKDLDEPNWLEVYRHFCQIIGNMWEATKGLPISYVNPALLFKEGLEAIYQAASFGLENQDINSFAKNYIFTATRINFLDLKNDPETLNAFLRRFIQFDFESKDQELAGQFATYILYHKHIARRAESFLSSDTDLDFEMIHKQLISACHLDSIRMAIVCGGIDLNKNFAHLDTDELQTLYGQLIDFNVINRLKMYYSMLGTPDLGHSDTQLLCCIQQMLICMVEVTSRVFSFPVHQELIAQELLIPDTNQSNNTQKESTRSRDLSYDILALIWSINLLEDYDSLAASSRQRLNDINSQLCQLDIYRIINALRARSAYRELSEKLEEYLERHTGALAKTSLDNIYVLLTKFCQDECKSDELLRMTGDVLALLTDKTLEHNSVAGMQKFNKEDFNDKARFIKLTLMRFTATDRRCILRAIQERLPRLLPYLAKARGFVNMRSAETVWGPTWAETTRDIKEAHDTLAAFRFQITGLEEF